MKHKHLLIILAVAAIWTSGYAQEIVTTTEPQTIAVYSADTVAVYPVAAVRDWNSRLYLGIKGGVNYSNVYDAQGENFSADPKYGLAAGVFVSIPLGRYLGIQPEVLFSQKGFQASGTLLNSDYKLTRTLNYLDIPLLVAVKAGSWLTLLAGPQYSYLMKQTDVLKNSAGSILQEQAFRNDNIRKNMLCFIGGLDFNFDQLVVGTRIGWDVQHNRGDGTSTTPRYKNVWLQGTLGLRF